MATVAANDHRDSVDTTNPDSSTAGWALRVWPAVVLLTDFWLFMYVNHTADMSMFARFMSRLAAYAVLLFGFLGWWLTRGAIRWRDRLWALAFVIVAGAATTMLTDKSMNAFGLFMAAFPFVFTAWILWLAVSRSLSPVVQRIGFCLAILLSYGYFTLIRFDGLDARQKAETSWRWEPNAEQRFLAARGAAAAKDVVPVSDAGAGKAWEPQPGDTLEYRGTNRDGVVHGVQLATNWTEQPPKQLWLTRVGPSWSGMIVVDGRLVTHEQRGDVEAIVCRDAATGEEIWVHEDATRFEESLSGAGPRGTPTYSEGRIFAYGGKGLLNCLNAETGEVIWSHDAPKDAEVAPAEMPQWGYSVSPLVVDGVVVVFAGGTKDKGILAYKAADGELAWTCPSGKQSYSSPQVCTVDGQKQILMHDNSALVAINPANGEILWKHPMASETSIPMLQPHVTESGALVVSMEPGAALLEPKREGEAWNVNEGWTTSKFRPGFSDFVVHKDNIYALDDGILCCLNAATGERRWKKGRYGHGQVLLLADQDALVISSEKGEVILVSISTEGHTELGRFQAIEGKTWNSPVIAGGRLFLRNGEEMAAYELNADRTAVNAEATPK